MEFSWVPFWLLSPLVVVFRLPDSSVVVDTVVVESCCPRWQHNFFWPLSHLFPPVNNIQFN
jgi:hypothetical protein